MRRFYILLFTFFQMCTAKAIGISDPGPNDLWIQLFIRDKIEEIMNNDDLFDLTIYSDSKTFELERTLSIGAPNANTYGRSLTVDEKDFIYITGDTDRGIYNNSAAASGNRDLILGKYDSQMNPIWTKQIGNVGTTLHATDIAVDTNDNVYVTGNTNRNYPRALMGKVDLFLIKFDSNGNQIWSKQKGIAKHETIPQKMTLDALGNVYIVGNSDGPLGGPLTGWNGFIIKFKSNGDEDWIRQIGVERAQSSSKGITFDKITGNIYIIGIGNINYETNAPSSIGDEDIFIFKYDSNGNGRFFAQLGSADTSFYEASISVDPFGSILIGGSSNGRFETTLGGTNKLGTIIKYDSRGTLQWVRQFGPIGGFLQETQVSSIITDKSGNIFTTGSTNGNILNGGNNSLGNSDAFLTKHNSFGQNKWMEQIGNPGAIIFGNEIAKDREGNLYTIGNTNGEINGTPINGTNDMFLIKYR
ncbi:beta-propeller repeat protein [Leptospira kirschneri serovar Bim str. 1051]|uniref:SBBP repeat beta-propeller lipoprotein, LipL53 family n=1 Tax=Leptospira kirschneri TaxID=29507 RepID=UPI000288CE87|nr:SBBP repeat-containing protein [Leptospira kirschneri]EMK11843.1 beta-propeller repeat protein [Leptospira kirschneri serovar Bim str. PUO 1247]EMN04940.1 beta-propeller repeat protein [Leptospira kirschneri serovar Bim str. 1051]